MSSNGTDHTAHSTKRVLIMRQKIDGKPSFPFRVGPPAKVYREYQERYNRIDALLEANPAILDAVHDDLDKQCSDTGRPSEFSSEQFLRMIVIKVMEGLPYRDTIVRVSDSDFLRNFSRLYSGNMMSFTVFETAVKGISAATWEKINAILSGYARRQKKISGKRLRVDSTVCESNIHYPTDASLLWDGYRVLARILRRCVKEDGALYIGNRFHERKIKRLYTFISTHAGKKTGATQRAVGKAARILRERVEGICRASREFIANANARGVASMKALGWLAQLEEMTRRVDIVTACAKRVQAGETVPAEDRIFSIFEPHTELLKRGKARKPVEFGHMVTIGQTEEKFISFYRVEEKSRHDIHLGDEALKDHKEQFGEYPRGFAADKNYYGGPDHSAYWKKRIPVYAVGKKGRRNEEETNREHGLLFRLLQQFRAGCEGSISVLKRVFGLVRCLNRGFNSFASTVGSMIFCHNLVVLTRL